MMTSLMRMLPSLLPRSKLISSGKRPEHPSRVPSANSHGLATALDPVTYRLRTRKLTLSLAARVPIWL